MVESSVWRMARDTVLFFTFTIIYHGTQLSIVLSFSFAQRAGVNEGIITSIWALTPLFGAVFDRLAFGVKLEGRHLAGMLVMSACATCISLSGFKGQGSTGDLHPAVPVSVAMVGAILMAARSFQGKHMVVSHGFNAYDLSFASLSLQGLLLFGALLYFSPDISAHYLVLGTVSSILNTLGGVFIVKASSMGPLGPVNAYFTSSSSILFCVIQFTRHARPPTLMELLGMTLGVLGALILTVSEHLKRLFFYLRI